MTASIIASIVLSINLIFTIWGGAKSKSGMHIGTIYTGDCSKVRHADSWVHIAINVMGTMLLGGSNYTMQCITAPTRAAVDKADAKGKYLDIGIPSFRNLSGLRRITLFALLTCSTIPLHFL